MKRLSIGASGSVEMLSPHNILKDLTFTVICCLIAPSFIVAEYN